VTGNAGENAEAGASGSGDNAGAAAGGAPGTIDRDSCHWSGDLPPGSYADSCRDCTFADGELSCSCEDAADSFFFTSTLTLTTCPSVDISNCDAHLFLGSCFEYNHQGACDTRSTDGRCVEYPLLSEPQQTQCAARCGVWSTDPCPVPDSNTKCCDYDDVHVCATGTDVIKAMYAECMSRTSCHC
jgi:hypothetical protein